ncbi:hypothetical protein WJX79_004643 [Trebouxia sp. C0005]
MHHKHVQRLQLLVHDCLSKHLYASAIFYADKLVSLSGAPADLFTLAQAFYMDKQYRRALTLLKGSDLIEQDVRFRYLAAKCLVECREWEECLMMVGGWEEDSLESIDMQDQHDPDTSGKQISYYSALSLLRGKVYDALENHGRAVKWYQAALKADPFCYEAFQILIDNHMLTADEEARLRQGLKFSNDDRWLSLLYQAKCKKYDQQSSIEETLQELERPAADDTEQAGSEEQHASAMVQRTPSAAYDHSRMGTATPMQSPSDTHMTTPGSVSHEGEREPSGCGLGANVDVLVCRAEWYYHVGAYQDCYTLTSSLLENDPYATEVYPVHITASLELRKKNELFRRAHKLVQEYPDRALAWFAVGCYYLCTQQYDSARRYFGKATTIENSFAAAWIGFGNAFAFQDESDQAMAAYRTAARLFPGLHLPLTGMGMEYQRMNNLHLAEQMFLQAHKVCPSDPLACNELGVLTYKNQQYSAAEQWLLRALELVPGRLNAGWESLVVNLGHCYRKQQRWDDAIQVYERALGLCPGQAGTYAALGFTRHLKGDLQQAIEDYHKALGLRPEDTFTAEMLAIALQDEAVPEELEGDDVFG